MKKLIFIVILIIGIIVGDMFIQKQKIAKDQAEIAKIESDYEKIEQLKIAMNKIKDTSAVKAYSNPAARYQFDVRAMYEDNANAFHKALKKELGDDFDTQLSTGDYLFAEILPLYGTVKIYAGTPQQKNENMLYPDWNYTKLEKR